MCQQQSTLKRLNFCTKFRACLLWAFWNIISGCLFIPLHIRFVKYQELQFSILILGCVCGVSFIISGIILLIGLLKKIRWMVCFSIVFSTIGTLFIHWLIIPFVLYFIFSFIVFNYYQVDMAIDDRFKIPKK
ncbi:uncharacterized protein LOC123257234 [Drosophila ananassae]|uniref:uncharacterized protein LOC123257234 n=1 Tax=Drosophila ananassae TaxID=7217 RepID=UPI001CFFED9B|nr:uncharacterized protein LOC123257234 [Drosophila ananassae]